MTWTIAAGLVGGLALLVVGAEALVRGASRLASLLGLSPLVIGLTVVAFGTSTPELAVSVGGAVTGAAEIAVGNVVGSNVFNLLAVLGASALAGALVVHQRIVRLDVPILVVVTAGVWALAVDGRLGRIEGLILLAALLAYTTWLYRASQRESPEIEREYAAGVPGVAPGPPAPATGTDAMASRRRRSAVPTLVTLLGLATLVVGANLLVESASSLAATIGVSELVIGLTAVAVGTSLPELATSVVAALRGQRDIAVGNLVGSNLFNLMGVLGAAAVVAPQGLAVAPEVLGWDLPIALGVALIAPLALATGLVVDRWEGALLLAAYGAYATTVVLIGTGSPAAATGRVVLLAGLAVVAGVLVAAGVLRRKRPHKH